MNNKRISDTTPQDLAQAWGEIKAKKPLVHHITNSVAVALQANICLAVGASPLMSRYPDEAEELARLAQGLLVNLGTPSTAALETVTRAMTEIDALNARGERTRYSLLDPVGYGASAFRVSSTDSLLARHKFSVIKGNAGEISLMAKLGGATRGVDAESSGDVKRAVITTAQKYNCVVCATGEVDYISDGQSAAAVRGGSSLLIYLSGSGCALGTVILSAVAACENAALGALTGLVAMGIASERASLEAPHSGTFAPRLVDAFFTLSANDFLKSSGRWEVLAQ
ncbi:hydroxyethylthiazole kinase [Synergistales bacterium]|nr:hydroxyethylthiazole kinase [Synergistales bacterium]